MFKVGKNYSWQITDLANRIREKPEDPGEPA